SQGQLVAVEDALNRLFNYSYYTGDTPAVGLLRTVTEFSGRVLQFGYSTLGELTTVTPPAVTDTPNGNNFTSTTQYTYSTGFGVESPNHNLLTVPAPNEVANGGPPRLSFTYDNDPNSPNADRVLSLTRGGTNDTGVPSGGTSSYSYQILGAVPEW